MKEIRFFSKVSLFSDYTNLHGEMVRVVSRSCEVSDDIIIERGNNDNFLVDKIHIYSNETSKMEEKCKQHDISGISGLSPEEQAMLRERELSIN